jgi:hypothetical protein
VGKDRKWMRRKLTAESIVKVDVVTVVHVFVAADSDELTDLAVFDVCCGGGGGLDKGSCEDSGGGDENGDDDLGEHFGEVIVWKWKWK